jgi:hypothetical protein
MRRGTKQTPRNTAKQRPRPRCPVRWPHYDSENTQNQGRSRSSFRNGTSPWRTRSSCSKEISWRKNSLRGCCAPIVVAQRGIMRNSPTITRRCGEEEQRARGATSLNSAKSSRLATRRGRPRTTCSYESPGKKSGQKPDSTAMMERKGSVRRYTGPGGLRCAAVARMFALSAFVVGGVSGCGGGGTVVAWVYGHPITGAEVGDEVTVLRAGGSSAARGDRARALESLIAERWLRYELRREGRGVSEGAIQAVVGEFEGGPLFKSEAGAAATFLRETGRTADDAKREAFVRLATQLLSRLVWRLAHRPSPRDTAEFYVKHKDRYLVAERRRLSITNRKTADAAQAIRREKEFRPRGVFWQVWTLERQRDETRPLEKAIFHSPLHEIVGPVRQIPDYFVFEVLEAKPALHRTFAAVRGEIERELIEARRRTVLARFIARWRARWRAVTSCPGSLVVPGCAEDRIVAVPDRDTSFVP